jgi:hypothetical protein
MSLDAKAISEEIVQLEAMKADGHLEYRWTEQVEHPRLRVLYAELEATGKAPLR